MRNTITLLGLLISLFSGSALAATLTWTGAVNGNWDTTTLNWVPSGGGPATAYTDGDTVTFDDTGANTTITVQGGGVTPGSVTFDNTTKDYVLSGGAIGGSGGITKQGTGTVSLATAVNTYTGATMIDAGRLDVSVANALGGTGSGTTVAAGATLGLTGAGITYAAEPVRLNGGMIENVSGNNTFPGAITLIAGSTIKTTAGTPTWSGSIDNGGFLLTFSTAAATTASGIVSGAGGLTKTGVGALTISGSAANTYAGETTVSVGTLTVSKDGALGSVAGKTTVADGATLKFTVAYPTAEPVTINGTGDAGVGAIWGAVNGTVSVPITLGSAASILSTISTLTLTGGIWTSGFTVTVGGAHTITIATGKITGTGGLTKEGAGTLTLSVASDYTGATTVSAGTLTAGADAALGTTAGSTTVAAGATLAIQGGITYAAEPLTLDGGTLSNTSGNNTWPGTVTLTVTGTPTISCASSTTLTVSGKITGAGSLTKTTAGSLTLSNDTNDFTGAATVSAGTLTAGAANALGGTGSGTTVASSATLALQGSIAYAAEPLTLNNGGILSNVSGDNTWAGDVTLTATPTITCAANTLTISGKLTGASGFNKTGAGGLTLSNDTNDFTGVVALAVNGGTLTAAVANALGGTGSNTTVAAGATLALSGAGITYAAEPVSLGGGTLNNVSGNNTFPGNITLTAASTIATTAGTPTWSGTFTNGGFLLTFTTSAATTVSGAIGGGGGLTKGGASSLALTVANGYTGATTVSAGTLTLKDSGTILSSSGFTVNTGASLILDNTGMADSADRVGAVALTLAGGTFQFKGRNGVASTETIGAVALTGGSSSFTNTPGGGGGTAVVTCASLTSAGGAVSFTGTFGTAANQIVFTAAPTLTPAGTGILPYATANDGVSTGFATYGANGIAVGGTGGVIDTAATGSDVVVSADGTMTKNRQTVNNGALNSLTIVNDGTDIGTDGGSYTLELTGGSVACYGNNCTISANVTLDCTTANAVIFVDAGKTLTISGPIAGSGSVTKSGTGTLVLAGNNTFTGTLNVNAGKVTAAADGALGTAAGGTVVASGATLAFSGGIAYSAAEAVTISGTGVSGVGAMENAGGNNSFGGVIALAAASTIGSSNAGDKLTLSGAIVGNHLKTFGCVGNLDVSGVIGGSGGVTKDGTGTMVLSGSSANAYTGMTTVNAGTLELKKPAGVVAICDDLTVGDGAVPDPDNDHDVVRLFASDQINFSSGNCADVTVNKYGLLDFVNGSSNTINTLTMNGGEVATGTGVLYIRCIDGVTLLTVNGAGETSKIGGTIQSLGHNGPAAVVTVNAGATLDISAAISTVWSNTIDKRGTGTLILSGGGDNNNLYQVLVKAGTLKLNKTPGNYCVYGQILVYDGAVLQLMAGNQIVDTANWPSPKVIVYAGGLFDLNGFDETLGGLELQAGPNSGARVTTGAGTLTLGGTLTLSVTSTGAVGATITGNLNLGTATRTFNISDGAATDDLLISAVISGDAGVGLTKTSAGRLTITSASTYTGTTTVSAGTLALKDGGTLSDSTAYSVAGGTLLLDESGTTPGNRLAATSAVTLNSGTLALQGKANAASAQTVGEMVLAGGNSTITNTPGSGTGASNLTGDRLTPAAGARLNCTGAVGTADNQIRFTLSPTLTNGVLPYATVAGADVATYNAYGIAPYGNYYTGIIDNAAATDNVRVTVNDRVTIPNKFINSLTIVGDNVTVSSNALVKLTLTSGALKTSGANQTFSVEKLSFGSGDGLIGVDSGALNITSVIQDNGSNGGFTKTGAGTLTLSGANLYKGATTISAGTLIAAVNDALGSADAGTTVADGATLMIAAGGDLVYSTAEPLTLYGNGVGDNGALNSTTNNNTFAGPITLASNATIGSATAAKTLTLSGAISETGGARSLTTKSSGGSGILILSNTGNSWTGATTISANSILRLGNSEVIPDKSALTVNGTLDLNNKNETFGSLANANGGFLKFGDGEIANTLTVGGDNNSSSSSGFQSLIDNISDATDTFKKTGSGNLILTKNNTFKGKIVVEQGILTANDSSALGDVTAGTEVLAGATLAITGTRIIPAGEAITLNGIGYGGIGALSNTADNSNTIQGPVTLASDSTIGVAYSTRTLTLSGAIGESGGAARALTKAFAGTLTLTAANTYTGATAVNAGTLTLSGSGTALGSSAFTVGTGGSLILDNIGTKLADRVGTVPLTLNGGTFQFKGNAAATTETIGNVTVSGNSTFTNTPLAGGAIMTCGTLSNNGNLAFTGTFGTGSNQILFGGPPASPIANATANDGINSGPAAYGGNGVEVGAGGVIDNAADGADVTVSLDDKMHGSRQDGGGVGDEELNSLTLTGNGTDVLADNPYTLELTGTAHDQLTATGGGGAALSISANVTIDFGPTKGVISVASGTTLTINGPIAGSAGIEKKGDGTLVLAGTSAYTGTTTVTAGTLTVTANDALGAAGGGSGTVVASGATLAFSGNVAYATAEAVTISGTGVGGVGAINNSSGANSFAGAVTLLVDASIGAATGTLTLSGVIDDGGNARALTKAGSGTLILSGASTYTGSTAINAGTLTLSGGSGALTGTSGISINRATLSVDNAGVAVYPDRIPDACPLTFDGGSFSMAAPADVNCQETVGLITFNSGDSVVTLTPNATGICQLAGTGAFVRNGSATLSFTRNTGGGTGLAHLTAGGQGAGAVGWATVNGMGAIYDAALAGDGVTNGLSQPTTNIWTSIAATDWNTITTWDQGSVPALGSYVVVKHAVTVNSAPTNVPYSVEISSGGSLSGTNTLTLGAGGLSLDTGGLTPTVSCAVSLSCEGLVKVHSGSTLTISSVISGGYDLVKTGSGTLVLSGNNTFTGRTTVVAGTLDIRHDNALGSATAAAEVTVQSGATLTLGNVSGRTIPSTKTLKIAGSGVGGVGAINNAANTNTISGNITIADNVFIGSAAGTLKLTGVVGETGGARNLTTVGAGTMELNVNTYSGTTTVTAGTLQANNPGATGLGAGAVTVNSGATLTLSGGMTYSHPITLAGGTLRAVGGKTILTGDITVTATSILMNAIGVAALSWMDVCGNVNLTGAEVTLYVRTPGGVHFIYTRIYGNVSGSGGIVCDTRHELQLYGDNTFTGPLVANSSFCRVTAASPTALGPSGKTSGISILGGTTLVLQSLTYANVPLLIQGAGYGGGAGALDPAVNSIYQGSVTLVGDADIGMEGGFSCTNNINIGPYKLLLRQKKPYSIISGNLTGTGILDRQQGGPFIFSGNDSFTGTMTISSSSGATTYMDGSHVNGLIVFLPVSTNYLGGKGTTGEVRMCPNSFIAPGYLAFPGPVPTCATLTTGKVTMCPGAGLNIDLYGTEASGLYDRLVVNGDAILDNATLNVTAGNGYVPTIDDSPLPFTILQYTGARTGTFNGLPDLTTFAAAGASFRINYDDVNKKVTLTCVKQDSATTLASSINPSGYGSSVTFTAAVRGTESGTPTPAGSVNFTVDGSAAGTVQLDGQGQAQLVVNLLTVGQHSISASYGGSTRFYGSTSAVFSQSVGPTETALAASTASLAPTDPLTLTATVTAWPGGSGTPAGTVTFKDGASVIGSAALNGSGVAQLVLNPCNLATGLRSLTAVYPGAANYQSSVSPIQYVTVTNGALDHYAITATTPQTINVGWTETLTAYDADNNVAASDSSTVVTLTSSSGNTKFYTSASYAVETTTVTLYQGKATLYVKNSATETIQLTAASAGPKTIASGNIVVSSSGPGAIDHYHITASTPQTAGQGFTATLTAHDASHNVVTNNSTTEVYLYSTGSGKFYTDNTYLVQTTAVVLSSGTATLYVKDNVSETISLTAADGNNKTTAAAAVVVIGAGGINHYFITAHSPQVINNGWTETLYAKDAANNTVTSDSSTVVALSKTGSVIYYTNDSYDTELSSLQVTLANGVATLYVKSEFVGAVTLTGTDGNDKTGTSASITVAETGNRAPTISSGPTANPNPANKNQTVNFSVTASDPDGDTMSYTWNFGNGTSGSGATPSQTYSVPGVYVVSVTVDDGKGGATMRTVSLTIQQSNTAPVITSNGGGATASLNIPENTTAVTTVTATDEDGDTLTYSISGGADAAKFSITSAGGVLAFITAPDFENPTDFGANNVYEVTVLVSDGKGGTDTQAISVTVTDANDAPVITSNGGGATAALSIVEGTTAVTTVTATDQDGDTLTYSISGGADAAKFGIVGNTGVLTFQSAPAYATPTDANTDNVYEVTVQVSDGNGGTDTQAISVTVLRINSAPVITSNGGGATAAISVPENTTAVTTVTATDGDGDTLSYSLSGGADAAKFSITSAGGVVTFITAPDFENPTDIGANNIYEVTVQVSDGFGGTATQAISVTVTNVNEPPTITGNPSAVPAAPTVGEEVSFSVTATDPDGDPLTYLWDFGDASSGSGASPKHTYATAGTYEVGVTVADGQGGTATGTLSLTVSAGSSGNQAPTITSGPTATPNPTHEGNTIAFTVAATDPEGDALTYLWDFGDGVTATGAYVEYAYSTAGTYTAGITVSDGLQAATASVLVVVQESGSNGAPVISSGPQATPNPVKTGNKVLLVAAAISSSEGKPLLTWDFGDGHNGAGGNVLHTYSTAGIYVATVTATDAAGRTSSASTLVEVAETGSSSDDLTVSKTAISLNFKKADSDAVTLSGLLRIDEDFVPEDLELAMDLGGIEQTFVLDAKGRDRTSKTEKFQLTVRYRKGVLVTGLTKYALQLRKGNFQDILESFGFVNETIKGETLSLPVVISTPATIYIGTLEGTYKAKMDSSGKYAARAK